MARNVSVWDRVVPVVLHEPLAIEHSESEIHRQRTSGRNIAVDVSIGVPQGRALRLLEAELDQELEELGPWVESTRDMRSGALVAVQEEQDYGQKPSRTSTSYAKHDNTNLGLPELAEALKLDCFHFSSPR